MLESGSLVVYVLTADINECQTRSENLCSDQCTDEEGTYSCDCPVGTTLAKDGVNCGGQDNSAIIIMCIHNPTVIICPYTHIHFCNCVQKQTPTGRSSKMQIQKWPPLETVKLYRSFSVKPGS